MTETIKISVIVPVYNVERYLHVCIDSLLNQTVSPYEIILVDDGSTDGSGSTCDEYEAKDPRFVVIHKRNAGLGYARNSGLEKVHGDYVLFVDSDDFLPVDALELLLAPVTSDHVDSVIAGFQIVDDKNNLHGEKSYYFERFQNGDVDNIFLPKLMGAGFKDHDTVFWSAWGRLFSEAIILKNEIRLLSERVCLSEDLYFNLDYFPHAKDVVLLPESCYYYRENPDSLTRSYRADRFEKYLENYNDLVEYAKSANCYEAAKFRIQKTLFGWLKMLIQQETPRYRGTQLQSVFQIFILSVAIKQSKIASRLTQYPN